MRCADCPVVAGKVCPATAHPRYCTLARERPDYHAIIRAQAGEPSPPASPPPPLGFPATGPADGRVGVGVVCPALYQAGAEAWTLALARAVDPARVAWRGCVVTGGPAAIDPVMRDRLAIRMPVTTGSEALMALAHASDLLVTWGTENLEAVLAGCPGRPTVLGVAHSPVDWDGAAAMYGRARGVDRWIAVSESARAALPEAVRGSAAILGNCVDPDRLATTRTPAEVRRSWGVPPGSPVCGYYGRLSDEKRPAVMVGLARHLPTPWRVVVVGPEYDGGSARRAAEGLDNIRLVGADPRAGDVLRAFDVMVAPSAFESWGLAIAEAIACGTPVVSTPVGIAAETPGLTRTVPHDADGAAWGRQVEAAVWEGRPPGQLATIARTIPAWSPGAFGRAWTDAILEAAGRAR